MDLFSLEFIIFLISIFTVYYLAYELNKSMKRTIINQWFLLLIGSLIFYGFVNRLYLIYLGLSSLLSYYAAILCQYKIFEKQPESTQEVAVYAFNPKRVDDHLTRKRYENIVTTIAIVFNVGILAVLKYHKFFAETINSLAHANLTIYEFIVPLGISFYTFSLIAYNVDCCKRAARAEKNPFKFLLFVSYFPKIIQGPISSYEKLKEDGLFEKHRFKDNDYLKSFFRISIGLIKKIAIANVVALYVDASYSNLSEMYGGGLIITSLLYTIQLYCDFSGFVDIIIGISELFGIKLEENFNIPYISKSITEFWRRWHISLGAWLKKYIYIPLGGNRVYTRRWVINTLIVWLVSGIWHGANWTFVVWGLFHGILIVLNGLPKQIAKQKGLVAHKKERSELANIGFIIGTFLLVNFGWIFFRAKSIGDAGDFLLHMVQFWKSGSYSAFSDASLDKATWLFPLAFVFIAILIAIKLLSNYNSFIVQNLKRPNTLIFVSKYSITITFFIISIFVFIYLKSIGGGGGSSFIYFDF